MDPELIEKLLQSFYVDDIVSGSSDEDAAYQLYEVSKDTLKEGEFNLRKFRSSSARLMMGIDQREATTPPSSTQPSKIDEMYAHATLGNHHDHSGERKVLDVQWDISTDEIVVGLEEVAALASGLEPIKRSIVGLVGRIYGPLTPVVVLLKIYFQELCRAKRDWDEPLTGELLTKWQHISQSLSEGQQIVQTPCRYMDQLQLQASTIELCGFYDASLKAYAAVVYMLVEVGSFSLFRQFRGIQEPCMWPH